MKSSSMKEIEKAIKSIPEKKENLRKALDSLRCYSSSLADFNLQWKDLEDHFSPIEKSIDERLKALKEKKKDKWGYDAPNAAAAAAAAKNKSSSPAANSTSRPELRSLCVNMDAKGLLSYLSDPRNDLVAIKKELAPAIRCAPDPALLVLDAIEGLCPNPNPSLSPISKMKGEEIHRIYRMICFNLLENLHCISPDISPSVREKAKKLAVDWKSKIPKSGDKRGYYATLYTPCFLHLITSYNLVSDFPLDDVMELYISVSQRKQTVHAIKSLGLTDKLPGLPDLIQKLNNKGRQLDAVKFVYALDMVDKFPPVPLLKAYITESKKRAQEMREKGNDSLGAQIIATAKELGAMKSVLKAVEEYNLKAEYPYEDLVKEIIQLGQKKVDKKRTATAAAASNSKQQQQPNKLPRSSSATSAAVIAANTYSPLTQTHPQLGLADRAPYMSVAGPYSLAATGSVYNHRGINLSGSAMGHDTTDSLPRSYYPSESLVGTSSLYDKSVTYNRYTLPGLPSSYGSSLYP